MAERELAVILKLVADQFQGELKKSGGLVGEFGKFLTDWKTQVAAAGTALFALTKSTANYGDELAKMSQRLGASVEDTARLQYAAKLADADLRGLSSTVGYLSQRMYDARAGSKEAQQGFAALGISVTQSNGQLKGATEILLEISDKFRAMPDGMEKTALAMDMLGRSGKEALPLLNSNLREAFTEADQLGLVIDTKTARAAERFNDELTRLQGAMRGLILQGTSPLLDGFAALSEGMRKSSIINEAIKMEMQGLAAIFTLTSHAIRETSGEIDAFISKMGKSDAVKKFWNDALVQGRKDLDRETEKRLHNIFSPSASKGTSATEAVVSASARVVGSGPDKKAGAEQERLGKALVDIFQTQQRAIELRNKAEQDGVNAFFLAFDRRQLYAQIEADKQEELGRMIVERTQFEVRIREQAAAEAGALQEQLGRQIVEQTQLELRLAEERRLATRTFFDEWADGMRKYVQDTNSGLGLGADMARRTFQTMEQSARTLFFDVMEGRVNSMKSLFAGLLDYVKQITSQIAGQLITRGIASLGGSIASGFLGGAGTSGIAGYDPRSGFATGGSFTVGGFGGTDSQQVGFMATPGERVTVETPGQQARGSQPSINVIINNHTKSEVSAEPGGQGPDGRYQLYITVRDAVKGMMRAGEFDGVFRQQFGTVPQPVRR